MSGLAGQTSFFPPPDPLLCWLWLAHVLGPASAHAGRVLDAFGGAQEAWEARDTAEFRLAAGDAAAARAQQLDPEQFHGLVMRCDDLGVRILYNMPAPTTVQLWERSVSYTHLTLPTILRV